MRKNAYAGELFQQPTRKLLTELSNVMLVKVAFIVRIIVIESNGPGVLARRGR